MHVLVFFWYFLSLVFFVLVFFDPASRASTVPRASMAPALATGPTAPGSDAAAFSHDADSSQHEEPSRNPLDHGPRGTVFLALWSYACFHA
jgi:hypothetical protein